MTNRCGLAAVVAVMTCVTAPLAGQAGQAPSTPAVPVISDTGDLRGPRQPIFFRHDVHAGQDQIPCLYCHSTATVSAEPGIPSVQTCMGCHIIISGSTPTHQAEIRKLRTASAENRPPEWVRIHTLPGFVRFPHQRHVKALGEGTPGGGAYSCTVCHGDVQTMPQVYQVETLRMGWCIRCHVERQVSRDCTICHY